MSEETETSDFICSHGNKHDGEPHSCPFQYDVHNDPDPEYCTCCPECEQDCADDI